MMRTQVLPKAAVEGTWVAVGVRGDEIEDAQIRFARLSDAIEQSLPTDADGYRAWAETAWRWAEWNALRWTLGARALHAKAPAIAALVSRVDDAFSRWMLAHYASLHNVSYPFFSDVATIVGRLLELQNEAAMAHIVRRTVELWGDREKVRGAAQKVVRSMTDWGCLVEPARGVFRRRTPRLILRGELASTLAEALIFGGEQSAVPLPQLLRHPAAFPFQLELSAQDLRRSQFFEIDRQGLDLDVVSLATRA